MHKFIDQIEIFAHLHNVEVKIWSKQIRHTKNLHLYFECISIRRIVVKMGEIRLNMSLILKFWANLMIETDENLELYNVTILYGHEHTNLNIAFDRRPNMITITFSGFIFHDLISMRLFQA